MSKLIFGPAGLGPIKTAEQVLEEYAKKGIKSCEIAFTYSIYIKNKEDAERIGRRAKSLGITLSIHAPYWVNLNSSEKAKLKATQQRILDCLKVGTWLEADSVVFHPGYYGKMSREETYDNVKNAIKEIIDEAKKEKYTPRVAPETMGKVNVFGSLDEVLKLVNDLGCSCCIDFAHILAREKKVDYKSVISKLEKAGIKNLHVHFSGIEYGDKGEKKHIPTNEAALKELIKELKAANFKEVNIINESPQMIEDTLKGIKMYNSFNTI